MQQTGNIENAVVYQTDNFFIMDQDEYEKEKRKITQFEINNEEIFRNISEKIQNMTQEEVDALNEKIAKYINEDKSENTEEDKSHD